MMPISISQDSISAIGHIAGKRTDEPVKKAEDGLCPTCGERLEPGYGFCRHGFGTFDQCEPCVAVFNFFEDGANG